ncbi:MAG: MFS transporter [Spirochaetaceae bacterium]|nr:MFS transporter [Spirochaetaceae bacterium]
MTPNTQNQDRSPRGVSGMRGFLLVWIGQLVSVLASGMSGFALTLFVYRETGSATAMGLMQVAYLLPFLLMTPLAGVMVDRGDRRLMMALSDLVAAVGTIGVLVLSALGRLEVWHLYAAAALNGIGNTFQWPAYSAAISLMVPKEQYGRADGLMSLMESGPGILSPLLAGALLPVLGLTGILAIDLATFLLALGALALVAVPNPPRAPATETEKEKPGLLKEAGFGFAYIFKRPGLLGLQLVFLGVNLFSSIGFSLLAPLVLARTGQDSLALASVQSAGALGAVGGGIVMSLWGGFKRRTYGVVLGCLAIGLFGTLGFGLAATMPLWIAMSVLGALFGPIANASSQAIWQSRVPPEFQGRVFSSRRLISWFTTPIAPLAAGLLADLAFEPLMRGPRPPALLAAIVGSGPGAGMSLILVACGLLTAAVSLIPLFQPAIRALDNESAEPLRQPGLP